MKAPPPGLSPPPASTPPPELLPSPSPSPGCEASEAPPPGGASMSVLPVASLWLLRTLQAEESMWSPPKGGPACSSPRPTRLRRPSPWATAPSRPPPAPPDPEDVPDEATRRRPPWLLGPPAPGLGPVETSSSLRDNGTEESHHFNVSFCCINRVLTHVDPWVSRTLNQMSRTKLNSRYKHDHCRTRCVSRAYAGLYFERLSLKKIFIMSNSVEMNMIITNFHDFSKTFVI